MPLTERQQMGKRGFDFAISRFSKSVGLSKIDALFKRCEDGN